MLQNNAVYLLLSPNTKSTISLLASPNKMSANPSQLFSMIPFLNSVWLLMLCRDADSRQRILVSVSNEKHCYTASFAVGNPDHLGFRHLQQERHFIEEKNGIQQIYRPEDEAFLNSLGLSIRLYPEAGKIKWTFDGGGSADLKEFDFASNITPIPIPTWNEFKKLADSGLKSHYALFRGHGSSKFRLESSLHRRGRQMFDLYHDEIFEEFRKELSSLIKEPVDDERALDALGLAQHYGLPTPLIDFSDSPYVAAFFAFHDFKVCSRRNKFIRIYALSNDFLDRTSQPKCPLVSGRPFVNRKRSAFELNVRRKAQGGEFLMTNIVDLERYIHAMSITERKHYLCAIDIPSSEVDNALADLRGLGIEEKTIYPDLMKSGLHAELVQICSKLRQGMSEKARHRPFLLPRFKT